MPAVVGKRKRQRPGAGTLVRRGSRDDNGRSSLHLAEAGGGPRASTRDILQRPEERQQRRLSASLPPPSFRDDMHDQEGLGQRQGLSWMDCTDCGDACGGSFSCAGQPVYLVDTIMLHIMLSPYHVTHRRSEVVQPSGHVAAPGSRVC